MLRYIGILLPLYCLICKYCTCNGSGQDPVVEAKSKGTIIYAWKATSERLLADELSADYDSLVSTSGPLATNISSFRFESPLGQDVSRHSSESSGCYILLEFCAFRVTTRLFSKHSLSETYDCYVSHWPISSPSCKRWRRVYLSTDCQLRPIRNIDRYNRIYKSFNLLKTKRKLLYLKAQFVPRCCAMY